MAALMLFTTIAAIGLLFWFVERVIDFIVFAEWGAWRELYVCKCGKWATPYECIHDICQVCGKRVEKTKTVIAREKFSMKKFRPIELGK